MSSAPGDGGFSNPTVLANEDEMNAHYAAQVEEDQMLLAMSPAERHFYLNMLNNANPEDIE